MNQPVLSVSELTERLRFSLETKFPFVFVTGEVCNLSRPASGHIYFSLKDRESQLQCALLDKYRRRMESRELFDPVTGEVFLCNAQKWIFGLRNGLKIICAGHISVYKSKGQYQLLIELMFPEGQGNLAQEFEEKKKKLAALGYFSQERKRALPANPKKIALITSEHGAAIHDFLKLSSERGCSSYIRLFPVTVQGERAASDIVSAIALCNAQNWAELIVIIRGGGSAEDLNAFNQEEIARAIFNSRLPVLAGIGHEVDFTLADLTADARAATPSHAAQLLWPLRSALEQNLGQYVLRLSMAMHEFIRVKTDCLDEKYRALKHLSPEKSIEKMGSDFTLYFNSLRSSFEKLLAARIRDANILFQNLQRSIESFMGSRSVQYEKAMAVLAMSNPELPLMRGYALIFSGSDKIIRSIEDVKKGDELTVQVADGRFQVFASGRYFPHY